MDEQPPARVRVTRCSNPYLWYADRIGAEFEVIKSVEAGYAFEVRTAATRGPIAYLVFADDCEPVDDLPKAAERG